MGKEYFNSNEFNNFSEYKKFSAEQYRLPLEFSKNGPEITDIHEENEDNSKKHSKKKPDKNLAEKLKDKLAQTTTHTTTTMSSALSATAITGTIAAVTVFTPIGATLPDITINEIVTGENSVYYSILADDLNTNYDYYIEIKNSKQKFSYPLIEGLNENVVEGLIPGYEYTLSMIGKDDNNIIVEYKKQNFYTLKEKLPEIEFDFIKHPQLIRGYSLEYNIDVTDKKEQFDSFLLNITKGDTLIDSLSSTDGKISGFIDQVPTGTLTFSIFGTKQDKQIFIKSEEFFVEEPVYSVSIKEDYKFNSNGKITIPFTISTNEMADSEISKFMFDVEYDGIELAPAELYNVKSNTESYITLQEVPKGAKKVTLTPKLYVSGGVDGSPLVTLDKINFNVPFNLELISKTVTQEKSNSLVRSLDLVFGMHQDTNTKLFINNNTGTPVEVTSSRISLDIDPSITDINYTYYLEYSDGTKSMEYPIIATVNSIPIFTFNYLTSLSQVFKTFNEDHSYNAYFDMRSSSLDPVLNKPNLYYNIVLLDLLGDEHIYSFKDDIAVIENLRDSYSIKYQVCEEIGDVTYIYQSIPLSGSISQYDTITGVNGTIMTDPTLNKSCLAITLDSYSNIYDIDNAEVILSDGSRIKITKDHYTIDEYSNYNIRINVPNDTLSATLKMNIITNKNNYQKYKDLGLIIGSPYQEILESFTPTGGTA